jgi:hypothetical protein
MPALKIFGKRIGGPKEEDFKKRISSDDKVGPNLRSPSRMSRQDFSEMTSKGPDYRNKVIKEVAVKPNIGSVDRTAEVIASGPRMDTVNTMARDIAPDFRNTAPVERQIDVDLQDKARRSLGFKKGGKVKCMSKGGSTASKRADGIATKGKTRGRII